MASIVDSTESQRCGKEAIRKENTRLDVKV